MGEAPPPWMVELANGMKLFGDEVLPTGVIVGSAVIDHVSEMQMSGERIMYQWHLRDVERAKTLRKPRGHPQPGWFVE